MPVCVQANTMCSVDDCVFQRGTIFDRKKYNSRWWEDEGVLGLIFAGYVLLVSQSPCPIIVYSVANYGPHLSHFWANT